MSLSVIDLNSKLYIMKKLSIVCILGFAVGVFSGGCNAPSEKKTDSVEAEKDSNENNSASQVKEDDSDFMIKAASGGMMEVEAGKIAQDHAQSQEVKNFGSKMVKDHSKANEELKSLAASKSVTLPTSLGEEEQKHITEMQGLHGKDFDQHYVNMMVNDHDKDVSMFEDQAKNAKDANVREWAAKTLPVLKEHKVSIKAIKDKM